MSYTFDGTNDYQQVAIDLSSTKLVTLSFWLWWDAFANNDLLAMETGVDFQTSQGFIVDPNDGAGSFGVGLSGAGGDWTDRFPRPSGAAWHHIMLTFDRLNRANAAWVDGVSQSMTAVTHTAGGDMGVFPNTTLYLMSRAGAAIFGAGRMARLAIWKSALTGTEAAILAAGKSPFQLGAAIPHPDFYWRQSSNLQSSLNGTALTNSGAVASADPSGLVGWDVVGLVKIPADVDGGTSAALDTTDTKLTIIGVSSYTGVTAPVLSDSQSNSYTGLTVQNGSSETRDRLFYKLAPTTNAAQTFDLNQIGSFSKGDVICLTHDGTPAFDQEAGDDDATPGTLTPGAADGLIVTHVTANSGASSFTLDANMKIVLSDAYNVLTNEGGALGVLVQAGAAGAVTPTWGFGGSPSQPVSTMASFIVAAAATGGARLVGGGLVHGGRLLNSRLARGER